MAPEIDILLHSAQVSATNVHDLDWKHLPGAYSIDVDADRSLAAWKNLRTLTDSSGLYPLLVDDASSFEIFFDMVPVVREVERPTGIDSVSSTLRTVADVYAAKAVEPEYNFRQEMLKSLGLSNNESIDLDKPMTIEQFKNIGAGRPPAFNMRMFLENFPNFVPPSPNQFIESARAQFKERVQFFGRLPARLSQWQTEKQYEQAVLAGSGLEVGTVPSVQDLIRIGESMDLDRWLELKRDPSRPIGYWDKARKEPSESRTSAVLLLLPVQKSWQVPAALLLGDVDAMPPSFVAVAMLKRWSEKYGAEVYYATSDAMNLAVEKPVTRKKQALKLAFEQFAFCPDNVLQGFGDGTISGLAVDLLKAQEWSFWWD